MKSILGINYYFGKSDLHDAVFSSKQNDGSVGFVKLFKEWMEHEYDVEIHTIDNVDWSSPTSIAALYFDYSWRYAMNDTLLERVPYKKRALMMIEPANVNPSLYFVPFYRNRFNTIFTWDTRLLERNKNYLPINVPVGAEPSSYKSNKFKSVNFNDKKLLIAVSRNRWSYMPQSTYRKRVAAYRYFTEHMPYQFDLFGQGWEMSTISSYRGEISGGWDNKVEMMSKYRFAICFENNASQPGYISEKILDCLCARCIPIYYGSKGIEKRIPKDCFIDFRDFNSFESLERFIASMDASTHSRYILAIDDFMNSPEIGFFSTEHYFRTLAKGLGLKPII